MGELTKPKYMPFAAAKLPDVKQEYLPRIAQPPWGSVYGTHSRKADSLGKVSLLATTPDF